MLRWYDITIIVNLQILKCKGNGLLSFTEHTCQTPGCGSVLVLDGNCKNYRDVCNAHEAGFIEFEGLEGVVKTGCMNTPLLKSRFCELHAPNVCVHEEVDPGGELGASERGTEGVVAMIMGKRDTRSGTYYQVRYDCRGKGSLTV